MVPALRFATEKWVSNQNPSAAGAKRLGHTISRVGSQCKKKSYESALRQALTFVETGRSFATLLPWSLCFPRERPSLKQLLVRHCRLEGSAV
jgi:hypothetical protein